MATTTSTGRSSYVEFDEYIDFQLQKTRTGIKATDLLTALAGVATLFLGYLLLFVVFDHWVLPGGFSMAGRWLMLGGLAAACTAWLVWKVVLPSRKNVTGLFAARAIEKTEPGLQDTLLNLVDLRRAGKDVSEHIRRAMEKRAAVTLSKGDVDSAVDRRPLMRLMLALLSLVVICALYSLISPKKITASVWRALFPASNTAVDTSYKIDKVIVRVENARIAQPGDDGDTAEDLTANAVVAVGSKPWIVVDLSYDGAPPEDVTLYYSTEDEKYRDVPVPMKVVPNEKKRYRIRLTGETNRGILQDTRYRIEAGDAKAGPFTLTVVRPPVVSVESVNYVYPKYMERRPLTQAGGHIDAWENTQVSISAVTDRPVSRAWLVLTDGEDISKPVEELEMQVEGTKLKVKRKLEFRKDGSYAHFYHIRAVGKQGLRDPSPVLYGMTIRRDLPPEVRLLDPQGNDRDVPVNMESLRLLYQAKDADFKLTNVTLRAELTRNGQNQPDPQEHSVQLFPNAPNQKSRKSIQATHTWDLRPLQLKVGDQVRFRLEARDNKPPGGNRGFSRWVTLRVVEPADKDDLDRQQQADKQRQDDIQKEQQNEREGNDQPNQPQNNADGGKGGDDPKNKQPKDNKDDPNQPKDGKGKGKGKGKPDKGMGDPEGGKGGQGDPQNTGRNGKEADPANQNPNNNEPTPKNDDQRLKKLIRDGQKDPQNGNEPQPKDGTKPSPKDGQQPKDGTKPTPKDGQQPKDGTKPSPKDGQQPKDGTKPTPKDGQQPKDGTKPSPKDGQQPKDGTKPSPKDGQQPKDGTKPSPKDGQQPKDGTKPSPKDGQQPKDGTKPTPKDGQQPKDGTKPKDNMGAGGMGKDNPKGPKDGKKPDGMGGGNGKGDPNNNEGMKDGGTSNKPGVKKPGAKDGSKEPKRMTDGADGPRENVKDDGTAKTRKADGSETGTADPNKDPKANPTQAKSPDKVKPREGTDPVKKPGTGDPMNQKNGTKNPGQGMPKKTKGKVPENVDDKTTQPKETKGKPDKTTNERNAPGNETLKNKDDKDQKSRKPTGGGEGGKGTPNDQGKTGSQQPGAGDDTPMPGSRKDDMGKKGKPGEKPGKGSTTQPKDGKGKGMGQADANDNSQPNSRDGGKGGTQAGTSGGVPDGKQNPNAQRGSAGGVGDPSKAVNNPRGPEAGEKADLEYGKKAGNLQLNRLEDRLNRGKVTKQKLKELGFNSEKQAHDFVKRMRKRINDPSDVQMQENLKSVRNSLFEKRTGSKVKPDRLKGVGTTGGREAPPHLRKYTRAFKDSVRGGR